MTSTGDPDLEGLRALVLTAELGSMSRAGAALSVSQQAVSQRIRAVEADLGVSASWSAPPVAHASPPAASGRRLGHHAPGGSRHLHRGHPRPARLRRSAPAPGGEPDRRRTRPARLDRQVARRTGRGRPPHPGRRRELRGRRRVREGGTGRSGPGRAHRPVAPDLSSLTRCTDHIVVVAPTHRWARMGVITPADLARTPLVLREEGSGTRETLETALSAAGHPRLAAPAVIASTTFPCAARSWRERRPEHALPCRRRGRAGSPHSSGCVSGAWRSARPLTAVWLSAEPSPAARGFLDLNPSAAQAPTPA